MRECIDDSPRDFPANVSREKRRASHLRNELERIAADVAHAMLRALLSRPRESVSPH